MTRKHLFRMRQAARHDNLLRHLGQEGMTLLEVMIACGIMAMAFVYFSGSLMSVAATNSISETKTTADAHLATVLEDLRNRTLDQVLTYQPPVMTGLGAGEQVTVEISLGGTTWVALPTAALASPAPNPAEIRVTVRWRDRMGRPLQARASTLVGR